MTQLNSRTSRDLSPAAVQALIVSAVERFSGRAGRGDALLSLSWRHISPSRVGLAVFLREEIDAGVVHALRWCDRGGAPLAAREMAGDVGQDLIPDRPGTGVPPTVEPLALVSVDPSTVEVLAQAAALRGFTVSRIGWVGDESVRGRMAA